MSRSAAVSYMEGDAAKSCYQPLLPFGNVTWSDAACWATKAAPRTKAIDLARVNIADQDSADNDLGRALGEGKLEEVLQYLRRWALGMRALR